MIYTNVVHKCIKENHEIENFIFSHQEMRKWTK